MDDVMQTKIAIKPGFWPSTLLSYTEESKGKKSLPLLC